MPRGSRGPQVFSPSGIDVLELEVPQAPARPFPVSVNYSANLLRNGYWHRETVSRRIESWRDVVSTLQPDLLFCDHAPSALLATRGMRVARAAMGTGFTMPPLSSPMPNVQCWFPIPAERLAEADAELLEVVNAVTQLETVASLFDNVERFLCVEPELDHYDVRTATTYHGTIAPSFSAPFTGEIFLYMSSTNRFLKPVLDALIELGVDVVAYIRGEAPVAPNIRYLHSMVDLAEVARRCSLAITHGGTQSSSLLLKHGAKVLICPEDLEKAVLGAQLQKRRLAHTLNWFAPDVGNVRDRIETILDAPPLPDVARFSAKHSGVPHDENVRQIVDESLLLDPLRTGSGA